MIIEVQVKSNSKKGPLIQIDQDGSISVFVREIAQNDEANKAVIKLLSDYYKVPKNNVLLLSGSKYKRKRFQIEPNSNKK